MINTGFILTAKDANKLREFKSSPAYSSYLKAIAFSPAYTVIAKEYIENIDISPDIKLLKAEGRIPDTISEKSLSDLFKQSIGRMAINIITDTVLLKEIEDTNIDEAITNAQTHSEVTYLMGLAEEKYYKEAERLVEEGKIGKDDLAFKGLTAYLSRKEKFGGKLSMKKEPKSSVQMPIGVQSIPLEILEKSETVSKKTVDLDSLDIQL
jgi:ribosomal protein L12E/L44/L45/RPP1/RPP2